MTFVQQQRRQYENPVHHAFDFYRRPANAIRAGRANGNDRAAMSALLGQANSRSHAHYAEISEGWLRYLGRRRPEVVDVGTARWHYIDLEVRLSPHLALREPDGSVSVVFLHFRQAPLSRDAADLVLWLMEETMADLLPGARAVAIDVRRSKAIELGHRNRQKIGAWVQSEALAFLSLWDAAA